MGSTGESRVPRLHLLLLALAACTAAVYARSLTFGFINLDDADHLLRNPAVTGFDLRGMLAGFAADHYFPLTQLSYAIEYRLFGPVPWVYHLTNGLLHVGNSVLVMLLCRRLGGGSLLVGGLAGFLFAFHPLHVESVAWVSERKDVLSTLFFLLALLSYRPGERRRLATFIYFVLALLSKSMALTLPLVLVVLDLHRGRRDWRRIIVEKIPFLALSVAAAAVGLYAAWGQVHQPTRVLGVAGRLLQGAGALCFYLGRSLVPINLSAYYQEVVAGVSFLEIALTVGFALLLAAVAWAVPRLRVGLATGMAMFLVTLAPVLRIIPFGADAVYADRYMYIPSVGLFLTMALMASLIPGTLPGRRGRQQMWAAAGLLSLPLLALGAATVQRLEVWRDSGTLWRDALQKYPDTVVARIGLADHLSENGDLPGAIAGYRGALELAPDSVWALVNLGRAHRVNGEPALAESFLTRALNLRPGHAEAHLHLARACRDLGRSEEALAHLEAIGLGRLEHLGAAHDLGMVYRDLGRLAEAEEWLRQRLEREPGDFAARRELAITLLIGERHGEAEAGFLQVLEDDPSAESLFNLGHFYFLTGRAQEARTYLRRALDVEPDLAAARRDLAVLER